MLHYYPETDTLEIALSDDISTESQEVYENVLFNFTADGKLASITIDPAGTLVNIAKLKPYLKLCA